MQVCNPDVPIEVFVMDLEGMYTEDKCVMGKMLGTEATLAMSFHAVQRLIEYAMRTGVIVVTGSISYYKNGHHKEVHCGKHTPKGTQETMGTRQEPA